MRRKQETFDVFGRFEATKRGIVESIEDNDHGGNRSGDEDNVTEENNNVAEKDYGIEMKCASLMNAYVH